MPRKADVVSKQDLLLRSGLALASELSLPAVLQKIVDLACEVARARYGALGVLGADRRINEFLTHGVTEAERRAIGRLPEGKGLLGALIHEARPLRLADLRADSRSAGFPAEHPPMTSFLGVPIAVRGQVFGNLYLTEKIGAAAFTQEDEDAVVTLAVQAGVAIENARLYQEAERARRRLEALNEVSHAILQGGDAREVLRLIARHARELVGAALATIATPAGPGALVVRVADGEHAGDLLGMEFPASSSISGEVMRTGRPLVLADASSDPRVHQPIVTVGGVGPALFVPLTVGGRGFGTLAVGNPKDGAAFSAEDLNLVEAFAGQAAVAVEYARVREELRRLALIEERERIAKELHDDIIQSLFAEGMALQAAEAMVHDPEVMRARLAAAVDHIDRVIRDLRNYIFGLRPGALADRHLDGALRDLAEGFQEGTEISIEVSTEPEAVSLLAGRAGEVIQLAREALSNAVRHSGGNRIRVSLAADDAEATLEVSDDGAGFDPAEAAGVGHGLANLRDRAEALGGWLEIDSARGKGTRVSVRIPL